MRQIKYFHYGSDFFDELERLIKGAETEILLSTYAFNWDAAGRRFFRLLRQKAKRGIKVQILIDGFGAWGQSEKVARAFAGTNVELKIFHAGFGYFLRHPLAFFYRDHARIYLFDRKIMGLGGMGIGDNYAARQDFFMFFSVPEDAAHWIADLFQGLWGIAENGKGLGKEIRGRENSFLLCGPHRYEQELYKWTLERISAARNSIVIASPWFLPSQELLDHILAARERGVEVMIFSPIATDRQYYDYFRALPLFRLIEKGVQWYAVTRYFHQKFYVIDDEWSVGSANFDIISTQRNYELNLFGQDADTRQELDKSLEMLKADARLMQSFDQPWFFRLFGALSYRFFEYMMRPKFKRK